MTGTDDPRSTSRRRTLWASVLFIGFLVVVSASFAVRRWDAVWAALPGRVGAPADFRPLDPYPPGEEPLLRLAVVGDVGTGDAAEWATAGLVAEAGSVDPFDALILLGDNAYPDGDPARLGATVFEPFGRVLRDGAALLPVLGNHDVRGDNAEGQIAALGMPGRWYAVDLGAMLFVGLDSTRPDDSDQLRWLEETLGGARAAWIVVALHHPPYSAGFHGSDRAVRDAWVPLFERYGVDLVFAGHDHDYQRSVPIGGVTYVVSGAGARPRPTGRAQFTAYSASILHFVEIGVWADCLELRAVAREGVFDSTRLADGC